MSSVVDLAHRMGLTVVAEGVETAPQDRLLRELGCDLMQGYFYGRPSQCTSEGFQTAKGCWYRTSSPLIVL